ncbi:hypothetical protein [Mycobacterium kyorinense]|uniref:hypothetical protein n=1 Tax=Mycobacterium kyorinense TaxID=487514 RepID=UPI0005EF204F|nr:hypothetical protein [Mycobacterium kyorinense]
MAAKHGTRRRYNDGCRCDDCTAANNTYQQQYRQRRAGGAPVALKVVSSDSVPHATGEPGPVECGVAAELDSLPAVADRPGTAAMVLALARILDNPRALSAQPAASKVLNTLLDELHSASARGRRGNLSVVRAMTDEAR